MRGFLLTVIFSASLALIKAQSFNLENAFPNLSFNRPLEFQNAGDGSNRLFVVSQTGFIIVFQNYYSVSEFDVFLDITSKVDWGGEKGLLGLAFHPNYKENGYLFVNYTAPYPLRTVVSRFKVDQNNPNTADPLSEEIIFTTPQPFSNHNGGKIAFGPDGYLYIALGDGGSGGDPQNNAQNLNSPLGKILRIDIDNPSNGKNYGIPDDNPFVNNDEEYLEEIFAFGLRNPWRFTFDPVTGWLWAADVGQNAWEEIDIVQNGKNYGWRFMEGTHCYNPSQNCDDETLEHPIWEYPHNNSGGWTITGGEIYRADPSSYFYGKYIYADFVSGNIWSLFYDGENPPVNELLHSQPGIGIAGFGKDENGNIYLCDLNGKIFRFEDPVTSVGNDSYKIEGYLLEQNFPNPFNSTTQIVFSVPEDQKVKLAIYDSLGAEIKVLFNDQVSAYQGYKVTFDTTGLNLATGIYFYRIETKAGSFVKKMVFLR